MTKRRAFFVSALLVVAGCDGGTTPPTDAGTSCALLADVCHGVTDTEGTACHEVGHDGGEAACSATLASCIAHCEAAQVDGGVDDGGHGHDDDAGHSGDDAGPADGGSTDAAFAIRFRARVGDQAAACGTTYDGFGPGGAQSIALADFRFYVHGIELLRADGTAQPLAVDDESPWQHDGVALLDFEDRTGGCEDGTTETRDVVNGHAPAGTYTGIRFVLGVPFAQNHQDVSAAAAPLNLTSMFWNWQGGYKFARIDAVVNPATPGPAFFVHVGSTGCDGTPAGGVTACTSPNRATITLEDFDVATQVIAADYAALVEGLDMTMNTAASPPGCMSGPTDAECTEVLTSFGVPFGAAPAAPDFFSALTL